MIYEFSNIYIETRKEKHNMPSQQGTGGWNNNIQRDKVARALKSEVLWTNPVVEEPHTRAAATSNARSPAARGGANNRRLVSRGARRAAAGSNCGGCTEQVKGPGG